MQSALQHLGAGDRHLGLRKTHTTCRRELAHFGQHIALEAHRERTQRQHTGLVQFFGAVTQHFHQTGFVQHRFGVGRADQAGHATSHGGGHFALQHARVFLARLAQARSQVHQTRYHDAAVGIDHPVGLEVGGQQADGHDAASGNGHIGCLVKAAGGVDHSAVLNE